MPASVSNVKKPKKKKKENNLLKKLVLPLSIIFSSVLIDQLTKIWAEKNLIYNQPVEVLGNFFRFTLVYNDGGAMGTNFGSPLYYLISAVIILTLVLVYIYLNRQHTIFVVPLAFIAAGAIGNIIDRLRLGKVVDFIDIDFFDINMFGYQLNRWWTFNIADSVISCSLVFLLVYIFISHHKKEMTIDVEYEKDSTP